MSVKYNFEDFKKKVEKGVFNSQDDIQVDENGNIIEVSWSGAKKILIKGEIV